MFRDRNHLIHILLPKELFRLTVELFRMLRHSFLKMILPPLLLQPIRLHMGHFKSPTEPPVIAYRSDPSNQQAVSRLSEGPISSSLQTQPPH